MVIRPYFSVYLNPKYGLIPIVEPQTNDASKFGPYGLSAAIIGSFCIKFVRFSAPT